MLVVAAGRSHASDELVSAAARAVAEAAGWDVRAVRLGGAAPEASLDPLDVVDILELGEAKSDELMALVAQLHPSCLALGLQADGEPELPELAHAFLEAPPAPLLFMRQGMRRVAEVRRVIVPLEGTPSTSSAMQFAEDFFCQPRTEITMVNVATGAAPSEAGSMGAPRFVDQEQYEWADWRGEFSRRFSHSACGRAHRIMVLIGEPAAAIAGEASTCVADLIILSWRGTFAEGHGETVRRLLCTAPCPVLVVSPQAPDAAGAPPLRQRL